MKEVALVLRATQTRVFSLMSMIKSLTQGMCFALNEGAICQKSSKQDTTTDSTIKAKYITAVEVAKEEF